MEMMEKVERLREKANVTYEEAKAALEETGGDLLDAIVLLERQGKVKEPAQSTFSTEYEEQKDYIKVRDKVEEQEKSAPSMGRTIGRAVQGADPLHQTDDFHRDKRRGHSLYDAHTDLCPPAVLLLGGARARHGHRTVLRSAVFLRGRGRGGKGQHDPAQGRRFRAGCAKRRQFTKIESSSEEPSQAKQIS